MSRTPRSRAHANGNGNGHGGTRLDELTEVVRRGPAIAREVARSGAARAASRGAAASRRLPTPRLPALPAALPAVPTPTDVRRRIRRAQRGLPMEVMQRTGSFAMWLRELTGRDVVDLESLQDLIGFAYRAAQVREHHREGRWRVDDYGFDPEFTETLLPLVRLIYRKWWRVETVGINNVPRTGPALLVSNHAGVLPLDGAMIKVALLDEMERHARALIATWFGDLPVVSWLMRRTGQTLGHPDDSVRLLRAGELVLVFPEGIKGTGKLWSERYKLRRFGRGGFVQTALRAQVPIIPISVVGSEETYPMLVDLQPIAGIFGMPYFPLTPTWPWLGPLGFVPLPSKWRIQFHPAVRTDEMSPKLADNAAAVMAVSDQVRDTIQHGLISGLMERPRTFRG